MVCSCSWFWPTMKGMSDEGVGFGALTSTTACRRHDELVCESYEVAANRL